jgi:hypothetical protein
MRSIPAIVPHTSRAPNALLTSALPRIASAALSDAMISWARKTVTPPPLSTISSINRLALLRTRVCCATPP